MNIIVKKITILLAGATLIVSLSGCLATALIGGAAAGAVGGTYLGEKYEIVERDDHKVDSEAQADSEQTNHESPSNSDA